MARLHPSLVIAPAVLAFTAVWAPAFAPAVSAAPEQHTLFGQPVNEPPEPSADELERRREAFLEGLERQGLVLKDNQVLPKYAVDPTLAQPTRESAAWDEPPHRATTFLNFFGGKLKSGGNASEGESPCVQGEIDYPGFKGGEQAALAIIQIFEDAAAPFGMRIAYDKIPPKHLPHSQVMMGGRPGLIGLPQGVLGVACNLDCGDTWWRDTTFAFTDETSNVGILATTALQEAAHAWGLDHIDGENNIMFPYATPGAKVWADTCTGYNDATGGIGCKFVHEEFCPGMEAQNDVAELNAYFGPDSPDTEPPVVVMMTPTDEQQFKKGDIVHVEVTVSDNFEGYGWKLMVPELEQELPVYNGQTAWDLPVPPKGIYTIRVEAIDHDRNVGFAETKIYVDTVPGEGNTTGGDDTTGGEPMTGEEGTGAPTEGTGDPSAGGSSGESGDTANEEPGEKGCSCRDADPSAPWLLALAGALGLRRRRRA
jgi:MYXO-CTERM domain-containing protein